MIYKACRSVEAVSIFALSSSRLGRCASWVGLSLGGSSSSLGATFTAAVAVTSMSRFPLFSKTLRGFLHRPSFRSHDKISRRLATTTGASTATVIGRSRRGFQESSSQTVNGIDNSATQFDLLVLGQANIGGPMLSNQLTVSFIADMMIRASSTSQQDIHGIGIFNQEGVIIGVGVV